MTGTLSRGTPNVLRGRNKAPQSLGLHETVAPVDHRNSDADQFMGEKAILGDSMDITAQKEARQAHGARGPRGLDPGVDAQRHHQTEDRRIFFANDGVEEVFVWKTRG